MLRGSVLQMRSWRSHAEVAARKIQPEAGPSEGTARLDDASCRSLGQEGAAPVQYGPRIMGAGVHLYGQFLSPVYARAEGLHRAPDRLVRGAFR